MADPAGTTESDPQTPRDDMFGRLPDPQVSLPTQPAPAPGSRRAAREAAVRSASASGETGASAGSGPSAHGTIEDLFTDADQSRVVTARTVKRRRRGCVIALLVLLLIAGGVTVAGVWVWNAYGERISETLGWGEPKDYEPGQTGEVALVTIREGDTGRSISTTLYQAGVTKTEDVFYKYLVDEDLDVAFYPGLYELRTRMSAAEALAALEDPASRREDSVLLREGLTVEQSLPLIAESVGVPLPELEAAVADPSVYGVDADSLEGWLFPATYTFQPGATANEIIGSMVERTRESLASAGVPADDVQRVLTIASIIQREARSEEDFYRVSRVIQNRLDQDMMLQMDSTAQYGFRELHSGSASTSAQAQHDDNAWNTYVHFGLPITPIANPGDVAIDAAMHPVDGDWLYFVTVNLNTGETVFTSTYDDHLRYVEQMRSWCSENPDAGC